VWRLIHPNFEPANREVLGVVCVAAVVVGLRTRLLLWGSLHMAALC
jgi:hypothetical protein